MTRVINATPARPLRIALGLLPFALLILLYLIGSDARLEANPNDKLLPAFSQIGDAIERMAFEPSKRSGEYLFWVDTASSLSRLGMGIAIAAVLGLSLGLLTGTLPMVSANLSPLLTVVSLVPPLALLPILFIVFGLGEVSKVALIAIGITPFLIRDLSQRVAELPAEQIVKAQTLGATSLAIGLRVALPQIMPRLLQAVRLSLGSAWLFLIAAEAIAAENGLGYRIFLVRRYLAMDVILTYVIWITLLAFVIDWLLKRLTQRLYPWAGEGGL